MKLGVLYRRILKVHKVKLPEDMRELGNKFVRNEFKQHLKSEKKFQEVFKSKWSSYLRQLESAPLASQLGKNLEDNEVNALTDDQKKKLEEMRISTNFHST